MSKPLTNRDYRRWAYVVGFFLAINSAIPAYFNSQYLSNFVPTGEVGLIFAVSSLIAILGITYTPTLLKKWGTRPTMISLIAGSLLLVVPLVANWSAAWIIISFTLFYALGYVIRYILDLYLEYLSDDNDTGHIRGLFMTLVNLAWLISPFIASLLITQTSFSYVYLIAALALVPAAFMVKLKFKTFQPKPRASLRQTAVALLAETDPHVKNIARILVLDFLLNFFYAVMVVYTSVYLSQEIGLSEVNIGFILTIMLVPFVLIEYPLGWLADKFLGEKEILSLGLVICALATISLSFIAVPTVWLWALVLFGTRIGAAAIEIMKETYLFKNITEKDENILGLSRNLAPISYIAGPLLASLFIVYFDLKYIFLVLGLIVFYGLRYSLALKDTK